MEGEGCSRQPPEPATSNHGHQTSDMSGGMVESIRLAELSSRDHDGLGGMDERMPEDRQLASNTPQHTGCPSDTSEGMVEALVSVMESERNEAQQHQCADKSSENGGSYAANESQEHNGYLPNELSSQSSPRSLQQEVTNKPVHHTQQPSEISEGTMTAIEIAFGDSNDDRDAAPPSLPLESEYCTTGISSSSMPNATTESLGPIAPGPRRATSPGVVHVQGRAPGQLPTWARRPANSNATSNVRGSFTTILHAGSRLLRSRQITSLSSAGNSAVGDREQQPQLTGTANGEDLYHQPSHPPSSFRLNPSSSQQEFITAEVRLSSTNSNTTSLKMIESTKKCCSLFSCQGEKRALNYFLVGGIILMIAIVIVLFVFLLKA